MQKRLLAGCVLFVLPQVWVERHAHGAAGRYSPIDFDGSLLAAANHLRVNEIIAAAKAAGDLDKMAVKWLGRPAGELP